MWIWCEYDYKYNKLDAIRRTSLAYRIGSPVTNITTRPRLISPSSAVYSTFVHCLPLAYRGTHSFFVNHPSEHRILPLGCIQHESNITPFKVQYCSAMSMKLVKDKCSPAGRKRSHFKTSWSSDIPVDDTHRRTWMTNDPVITKLRRITAATVPLVWYKASLVTAILSLIISMVCRKSPMNFVTTENFRYSTFAFPISRVLEHRDTY